MKRILIALVLVAVVVAMTAVPVSAAEVNVAKGASYTANIHESYPDTDGKEITDGVAIPAGDEWTYAAPEFAGLSMGQGTDTGEKVGEGEDEKAIMKHEIIINLGASKENLSSVKVYFLNAIYGISLPSKVGVSYSDTADGTYSTPVEAELADGSLEAAYPGSTDKTDDLAQGVYSYTLDIGNANAQYIKIELYKVPGWLFVSEVEVYAGEGGGDTSGTPSDESSADAPSDTSSADAPSDMSSAASTPSTSSAASSGTGSKPGDSNMALYIVLAVVAVAGASAAVVLSRRKSR